MTNQQVAIVTGAARGIGAATALALGKLGYRLALVDCEMQELKAVGLQAAQSGIEAMTIFGDLADLAFAESTIQTTWQRWGRIDVLVNNAVWRKIVTMRSITIESWEKTLRVGLTTPAFLARWAAQRMEERRSGVIVNVSSIMAQRAAGICPAYVACKGALDALTYETSLALWTQRYSCRRHQSGCNRHGLESGPWARATQGGFNPRLQRRHDHAPPLGKT